MVTRSRSEALAVSRATAKAAELASGIGAIALGAGLALLAPDLLRPAAFPILAVGVLVHGAGMSLKHRLESGKRDALWWETALFWLCWACLAALAAWLIVSIARG